MIDAWSALRATRHAAPGYAERDQRRRQTYTAGLEQAQQLFHAADVLGPAASPLPLYYGCSQAVRALAAAFNERFDLGGHGLRWRGEGGCTSLAARSVTVVPNADASDVYSALHRGLESPAEASDLRLGDVWNAVPDLSDLSLSDNESPARALWVEPDRFNSGASLIMTSARSALVGGWRAEVADARTGTCVEEELLLYPSATGATISVLNDEARTVARYPAERGLALRLTWLGEATGSDADRVASVRERCHQAPDNSLWLLPALPGTSPILPLAAWHVLLYGMSMLARYEPRRWVSMLAVDASADAVAIENSLRIAVVAVPQLLRDLILQRAANA